MSTQIYNKRASKYNAKKTAVDGHVFDSKKEAERYRNLCLLEKAGEIRNLQKQVAFEFVLSGLNASDRNYHKPLRYNNNPYRKGNEGKKVQYIADFVYEQKTYHYPFAWIRVVEDCKGYKTDVYKLKKALMKWFYDIDIFES